MLSLHARLVMAASIVLAASLGLTGWALDRSFRDTGQQLVRESLQAHVYGLLAAAELNDQDIITLPDALPDPRFSTPGSGLYAAVVKLPETTLWRSQSMLGVAVPFPSPAAPGHAKFVPIVADDGQSLMALSFSVAWETDVREVRYAFQVAESQSAFATQLRRFRQNLWGWFGAAAVVLLALQGFILRWSLAPLREVATQVTEIEQGEREHLSGRFPRELEPLTRNLNTLIYNGRRYLERSRNALADLAHSLKTPLAVLRNASTRPENIESLTQCIEDQVDRMDTTVDYQLQRAAASGSMALAPPLDVGVVAEKLKDSLAKVYRDKALKFDFELSDDCVFYGDEGDLMEILGNLLENACKWAESKVQLYGSTTLDSNKATSSHRPPLILRIDDDGPGIPADAALRVLERGTRMDERTPGHGIGLAVVHELVTEVYHGTMHIGESALGGTRIDIKLRFEPELQNAERI